MNPRSGGKRHADVLISFVFHVRTHPPTLDGYQQGREALPESPDGGDFDLLQGQVAFESVEDVCCNWNCEKTS